MKLLHCADIHLDSKMESNLTKEQAKERKGEILDTFARMIQYAQDNGIRAIMISGDLFDTPAVEQKRIKNRVAELIMMHPDIDFLYLRGNHDQAVLFADTNIPDNFKDFGDNWSSYRYDNVVITGLELHKDTSPNIYDSLILNQNDINIIMLHGQESMYDNAQNAEIIPLPRLADRYIDYLALGHIHSYKEAKLDQRGLYAYSGCLEGRGFDECGQKGFVELNITDGKITTQFHSFAKRLFHEIKVDITGIEAEIDIVNVILSNTANISQEDLVKVILVGEIHPETEIDLDYLIKQIQNHFYFVKIYDSTKLMIQIDQYANEVSLKGEFVRCIDAADLPDEDKKRLILTGIKALMGREIG